MAKATISAEALRLQLKRLEWEDASVRLAVLLGLDTVRTLQTPGRLHFLHCAFEARPALIEALNSDRNQDARREWTCYLNDRGNDARLWHGLAVLLREHTLAQEETSGGRVDLRTVTALWCWLLCSPGFWEYFACAGTAFENDGSRQSLAEVEREHLFSSTVNHFLCRHRDMGDSALSAGRIEPARAHMHCLIALSEGHKGLQSLLDQKAWPCSLPLGDLALESLRKAASQLIREWGDKVVEKAKKLMAAPGVSAGGDDDYARGVAAIGPFIDLGAEHNGALRTSLDWHNQWCKSCYDKKQGEAIARVVTSAILVARHLEPLCSKGEDCLYNSVLSMHYLWRGLSAESRSRKIDAYKMSLEWDRNNWNAQSLLDELGGAT